MSEESASSRRPVRTLGIEAARRVRRALGYEHPAEVDIEVLAFMRGAVVRKSAVKGARANLVRFEERGIIGVADGLSPEERRWAVAHELGHFEAHSGVSFLGLCSTDDMLPSYRASGLEPEANAFAAELLMPEDLFAPGCDVAKVSWDAIRALAKAFCVSETAAALRFVSFSPERVALVSMKDRVVQWSSASKDFGKRPRKGARVKEWTEARAWFDGKPVGTAPETVSASAWIDDAEDDEELVEHLLPLPKHEVALSLLWWK